jgi:hypothetical protein
VTVVHKEAKQINGFLSDIEIAQACEKKNIREIAEVAGVDEKYLEQYGKYKAKVDYSLLKDMENRPTAGSFWSPRLPPLRRRGQDHHICRSYRRAASNRKKVDRRAA